MHYGSRESSSFDNAYWSNHMNQLVPTSWCLERRCTSLWMSWWDIQIVLPIGMSWSLFRDWGIGWMMLPENIFILVPTDRRGTMMQRLMTVLMNHGIWCGKWSGKSHRKGKCPKMKMRWIGPLVMLKKLNGVKYQVKVNEKGMKIIHYGLLKLCEAWDVPYWVRIAREKLDKKH